MPWRFTDFVLKDNALYRLPPYYMFHNLTETITVWDYVYSVIEKQLGDEANILPRPIPFSYFVNYINRWLNEWHNPLPCQNEKNINTMHYTIFWLFPYPGSGKTSLLDAVASRIDGKYAGTITFQQQPLSLNAFRKHAGYVIQADRLLPSLTVEETLSYTAQLKLQAKEEKEEILKKVGKYGTYEY